MFNKKHSTGHFNVKEIDGSELSQSPPIPIHPNLVADADNAEGVSVQGHIEHGGGYRRSRVIAWGMDIAFNAGAIGAHTATFFDTLVFGIAQDVAVDHFPRTGADSIRFTP